MNLQLEQLILRFKQSTETIQLSRVTYFFGQMGAGKSSIARLIDYCFGGHLDPSPALQNEFVSARLDLRIHDIPLSIERARDSNQVIASWATIPDKFQIVIPARKAEGEVIPNTGVETLSDLLFYLSGVRPPKVRRSKSQEDTELARLSLRDLLWYCYLDQDSMDSSFFHLDADANFIVRQKSKDVLRFVLGFHQEQVSSLEIELQQTREQRLGLIAGADSLSKALASAGIGSRLDIQQQIDLYVEQLKGLQSEIALQRSQVDHLRPHAVDSLRSRAQDVFGELEAIDAALLAVSNAVEADKRHLNEIEMLRVKFHRAAEARAVLAGVAFEACPRCAQPLPDRGSGLCPVCGQTEPEIGSDNLDTDVLEKDAASRIAELKESIDRHRNQQGRMRNRKTELERIKGAIDRELDEVLAQYDSAYLSSALATERRRFELDQHIATLGQYRELVLVVEQNREQALELEAREVSLRSQLKEARAGAESDVRNLKRLEALFLDCLVRSQLPGISESDSVSIKAPNFLPEVRVNGIEDLAVTSFANISSGGKKSLFKACFAIALHRLAVEINAILPTLLIIDSPMKNISERENLDQFRAFHELVYSLALSDLANTQFVLIDKEYYAPPEGVNIEVNIRYMKPNDSEHPPLVPYYRGH